jgi:glycosyltransferase involved in cell wall biosynthesis
MLKAVPNPFQYKKALFFLAFAALFLSSNFGYGSSSFPLPSQQAISISEKSLAKKNTVRDVLVEKRHKRSHSSNRRHSSSSQAKKNEKKTLFILPHLVIGGLDRAFIDMLHFLPRSTSEYDICILHRGGAFECLLPEKARLVSLKRAQRSSYGTVVSYAHWIDPSLWVGRIRAKRYVQWLHADLSTIGGTVPLHKGSGRKGIDYFVGVSEAASKSLVEVCRKLRKRTITIHNCVDEDEIIHKSQDFQNEIVSDGKTVNVVTVCRLSPEKGIARMIKVHGKLNKKGVDFRWYFIGSGPQQKEYEKLVESEGLEGKVFFLGYKMNPYPYMKAADINVLGSYSESWGLVITEAMILHRPVLSTEVGGSVEQIASGRNGLIVPNDEDGLYDGLKLLVQNEEIRQHYVDALANFRYDNDTIISQLEALLYPDSKNKRVSRKKRHSHHTKKRYHSRRKGFPLFEGLTPEQQVVQDESFRTNF